MYISKHTRNIFFGKGSVKSGKQWLTQEGRTITHKLVNVETFSRFTDKEHIDIDHHLNAANDEGKVFLFSNEQFSESVAPLFQAQQMKSLFPDGKVLIIIRNQYDMLRSLYKFRGHFLEFSPAPHKGKYVSFKNFVDYAILNMRDIGGHKARDWHGDYLRIINFSNYIDAYADIFGKDNIGVFTFESFIEDRDKFIDEILEFMSVSMRSSDLNIGECRKNTSVPYKYIKFKRMRHYFFRNMVFENLPILGAIRKLLIKFFSNKKRVKEEYTSDQLIQLKELLSEGNKKINKQYNLNLERYNYPL